MAQAGSLDHDGDSVGALLVRRDLQIVRAAPDEPAVPAAAPDQGTSGETPLHRGGRDAGRETFDRERAARTGGYVQPVAAQRAGAFGDDGGTRADAHGDLQRGGLGRLVR